MQGVHCVLVQQWALHMPHVQTQHNPGADGAGSAGESSCSCFFLQDYFELDSLEHRPATLATSLQHTTQAASLVANTSAQGLFRCCADTLCWGFCPSIASLISADLQFGQRSEEEDQVIQEAEQQLGKSESKLKALLQQVSGASW